MRDLLEQLSAFNTACVRDAGLLAFGVNVDLMQVDCAVTNIKSTRGIVIAAWARPGKLKKKEDVAMDTVQNDKASEEVLRSTEVSKGDVAAGTSTSKNLEKSTHFLSHIGAQTKRRFCEGKFYSRLKS